MRKLVVLILIGLMIILPLALRDYLSLEFLLQYKDVIGDFVLNNYYLSVIIFLVACAIFVNSPIPVAGLLKILGGFLFGATLGSIFNIIGTFAGAILGFIAARYLLHKMFKRRYEKRLHPIKDEIKDNGLMYFMALRFTMIFPYFLIHILGGISEIRLAAYTLSTIIGIIPGSIIYGYTGNQIDQVNTAQDILTWEIGIATTLLVLLSLTPVIIKKVRVHIKERRTT